MKAELLKNAKREGNDVIQYENRPGEMMDGAVLKQGKEGTIPGVLKLGAVFENGVNYMFAYTEGRKSFSEILKTEVSAETMLTVLENVANTIAYVNELGIPLAYAVLSTERIYIDPEDGCAYIAIIPSRAASMELNELEEFFRSVVSHAIYAEDATYVSKLLNALNKDFNLENFSTAVRAEMEARGIEAKHPKKAEPKEDGPSLSAVVQEEKEAEEVAPAVTEVATEPEVKEEPKVEIQPEVSPVQEEVVPEVQEKVEPEIVPEAVPQDTVEVKPEVQEKVEPAVTPEVAPAAPQPIPQPEPVVQAAPQQEVAPEPIPQPQTAEPAPQPVAQPQPAPQPQAQNAQPVGDLDDIEFEPIPEELQAKINKNIGKSPRLNNGPQPMISPQDAGLAPKTPNPHLVRVKTGEKIALPETQFVIGKSANGTDYIVTDNSAVSRIHCTLFKKNGAFYVRDENSTNGTFVDHARLGANEEKLLLNDASLVLGNEEFIYSLW